MRMRMEGKGDFDLWVCFGLVTRTQHFFPAKLARHCLSLFSAHNYVSIYIYAPHSTLLLLSIVANVEYVCFFSSLLQIGHLLCVVDSDHVTPRDSD